MSTALSELAASFVAATNALVGRFDAPVPTDPAFQSTCSLIHGDGQALSVVKLQNLWGEFCHTLIDISTSYDTTRVREASNQVASDMGYSYPVWHQPEFVVRVARHLSLTNLDRIDLDLGANLSSGIVTRVRNYIVHPSNRNESRFREIAATEGIPRADLNTLLNAKSPGGATLFERWVRELQRTANNTTA